MGMQKLDRTKVVNAVHTATSEVFSMMMGLEIVAEDSYDEANASEAVDGVVALIGLAGQWVGGGVLQCDVALARKLYSSLLMAECDAADDSVNEEVLDAMAEIANMIIGNVKNVIERDLGPIGMGIPSVVFGRKFTTRSAGSNWIVTPFACDGGHLWVKFCLTPPAAGLSNAPEILGREFARAKHPASA
jgi:chemotaxis protein CheX